ncbi:hypothetical protein FQZ97_1128510 [compost metagenome]
MVDAQTQIGFTGAVVQQKGGQAGSSLHAHAHHRQVKGDHLQRLNRGGRTLTAELNPQLQAVAVECDFAGSSRPHRSLDDRVEVDGQTGEHLGLLVAERRQTLAFSLDLFL